MRRLGGFWNSASPVGEFQRKPTEDREISVEPYRSVNDEQPDALGTRTVA
jgi:hypothetical protein